MAITPYDDPSSRRFYKAMRQRRYDDALQEVVPRDEWAEFWAEKVERELKRLADTPASTHVPTVPTVTPAPKAPTAPKTRESPQAALIRVLKAGQLEDAKAILQQWCAHALLSRGKLTKGRLDDQKIQALREVFSCEQINDKSKVDWAILVCEADASSPAADALGRLVNFISDLGLTCEGSLRYLHASIKTK